MVHQPKIPAIDRHEELKVLKLLAALGADPLHLLPNGKWPEDVFGWVLLLEYDENGHLNAAVKDENLMPGDAANPPPQPST
jgi:hypothetical protein